MTQTIHRVRLATGFFTLALLLTAGCQSETSEAPDSNQAAAPQTNQPAPSPAELSAETFFDPDHIVEVDIRVPEQSWDTIRIQARDFASALIKQRAASPFTYVKADVTINGVVIKDVGLRKKGFLGSLDDHRPSLKIKFAEYVDQSPASGFDRLTLNNNKQDPTRLSQLLSYRFFNQSGTVAPRCNLARVTVNGKYLGIYSNVESIKPPMLENGFGDGSGALFEGTVVDFYVDSVEKFEKKNKQADYEPLHEIARLLAEADVDLAALGQLVDIESFINFWATESLLGFWDGYNNNQNNFFIYQDPADDKFDFIPWGADALFQENMPLPPFLVRPRFVNWQSLLANQLYRIPETQQRYHERMNELLEKYWSEETLLAQVNSLQERLTELVHEDNKDFTQACDRFRSFIKTRRGRLEKEMADGPVTLKGRAKIPFYFRQTGHISLAYEARWFDTTPQQPEQLGSVTIDMELAGEKIQFKQIGVFSEHSKWPPLPPNVPKPPSIVFIGTRVSDGETLTLGFGVPIEMFKPTEKDQTVQIGGIVIEGEFGKPDAEVKMVSGRGTFSKAEMKEGSAVTGTIEVFITEPVGDRRQEPR